MPAARFRRCCPHRLRSWLPLMLVLLPGQAIAAALDLGPGARSSVSITSFKTLRDRNVIKQKEDYSCGAAALATLLSYGLGDKVGEAEILSFVLEDLSPEERKKREDKGLSLLDMQRFVESRGYRAQAFRLAPEYLARLSVPVIVFVSPEGYDHFAVLKGVRGGRAFLADPSLGNETQRLYRFLDMWLDPSSGKGIVFVVERIDGVGDVLLLPPAGDLPAPELLSVRQFLKPGFPATAIRPRGR